MEANGWHLFQHPLFKDRFDQLLAETERIEAQPPNTFQNHRTVKLLLRIIQLITEDIPAAPGHDRFNQGNTLGTNFRHWKRAKFGRYRLFFRYQAEDFPPQHLEDNVMDKDQGKVKAIVYAWVNDENTLRKDGDKNDPYAIFAKGLLRGKPPDSFKQLLKEAKTLDTSVPSQNI